LVLLGSAVSGSGWGSHFLDVLPRYLFVSMFNFFITLCVRIYYQQDASGAPFQKNSVHKTKKAFLPDKMGTKWSRLG
jgi:hypothetical protein